MSTLNDCYPYVSTPFGELGPFYDAAGHRGADYPADAGSPILAYDDMVVEFVGRTDGLGGVIGLRRLTLGGFAGFAHVDRPAATGARIPKGAVLGYAAGWDDDHGSLWSGPHIHTTESALSAYAAALGVRPLTDPAPDIAAAVASSSPAGAGDVEIITTNEEEGDMDTLFYVDTTDAGSKWLFSRSRGKIVREIPVAEWQFLRAVEKTAGGIPITLVRISAYWLDRARKLG